MFLASSISARMWRMEASKADEDRLANQIMADVEFADFGQGSDGLHIFKGEPVTGMDFEPDGGAIARRFAQLFEETLLDRRPWPSQ